MKLTSLTLSREHRHAQPPIASASYGALPMIAVLKALPCWLLALLPAALALVFSGQFAPRFAAPKVAIFIFATFLLAACATLTITVAKPTPAQRLFWLATLLYSALQIASSLHAPDHLLVVQGVVLALCGPLLLAATAVLLGPQARPAQFRLLQTSISLTAVLVAIVILAQFLNLKLPGTFWLSLPTNSRMRLYATLGNPDFVATLLAAMLPFSIALAYSVRQRRLPLIALAVLIAGGVVATGSRGGILALAAGLTVAVCTILPLRMLHRRTLLVMLLLVCALAATTALNSRSPWQSLRGRMLIGQVSLADGAAFSPLGTGPGTFAFHYPRRLGRFYANPGHESLLPFASHERHAQNDFVEAWYETGWLGLTALLALLGCWFIAARQRLHFAAEQHKPAITAAMASVCALCVAALFDFPLHRAESLALFWIALAIPMALPPQLPAPSRRLLALRIPFAILLVTAGAWLACKPLTASYFLARGESLELQARESDAIVAYRAALQADPASPDAHFELTRALANHGDLSTALDQSWLAARFVDEPDLYLLRARILLLDGRSADAHNELQNGFALFPYAANLR